MTVGSGNKMPFETNIWAVRKQGSSSLVSVSSADKRQSKHIDGRCGKRPVRKQSSSSLVTVGSGNKMPIKTHRWAVRKQGSPSPVCSANKMQTKTHRGKQGSHSVGTVGSANKMPIKTYRWAIQAHKRFKRTLIYYDI